MRLFLQAVLAAVAILVSLFSAISVVVIATSSNPTNKFGNIAWAVFFITVALLVFYRVCSVMRKDRLILEVVGILPGRIDEWKWRQLAKLKVEDELFRLAVKIKDLDERERDLLQRVTATPEKVLEIHKEIKGVFGEFREIHDLFQESFDLKLKNSWNDYVL